VKRLPAECSKRQAPISNTNLSVESMNLLIAEYAALRDEIAKKFDAANRLLEIDILATGVFLGFGIRADVPPVALLFFPIPVMFLALAWGQHHAATAEIGNYIRTYLEPQSGGALSWETYLRTCRPGSLSIGLGTRIPNGAIFLLSQGLALLVALGNGASTFSNQELFVTALSVGSIFVTARNLFSLQP
jgi:hypothetical protein